ncbi:flagellar biosynthetic protein FlhB [Alicyclobacillus cellulosilyticus]|uniref:Flagellar biosynthetic protein FlhB n=1 Tax=Alicyclobacillus cellulosilyticus TaxID=1003997 RepID=A0A917NF07_9BACL|nr:flagellar biosynthesis protein FlhB [Alicyclobacillus cellulosilyticus]GGI94618.1 flagellar biosynthetic protein FlhB [Alicyclobacillus cellulosilyticus]
MLAWDLQRFAGEKTERATPERRREARRAGQVPRSAELTGAIAVFAAVMALRVCGPSIWSGLENMMTKQIHDAASPLQGAADVQALAIHAVRWFVWLAAVPLAAAWLAAWVAGYAQVGALFRLQAIAPDWKRIDPFAGLRRLFSLRGAVEVVKAVFKLAIIALVAYTAVTGMGPRLERTAGMPLGALPAWVGSQVYGVAVRISAMLLALAVADYLFARFEHERSIRMSREEIKEEMRRREGDPAVRARIRQRGRAIAMRRMMQEVPKADVVITNPVHLAVALRYDAKTMAAPTVIAKGADEIARRMREVASAHGVPVVEDRPLARALYQRVDIGQLVPPDLYQAVAQVLAYVYRLRGRLSESREGGR